MGYKIYYDWKLSDEFVYWLSFTCSCQIFQMQESMLRALTLVERMLYELHILKP